MNEKGSPFNLQVSFWVQERLLGAGTFGQVELWRNTKSNERVAIKVFYQSKSEKHLKRYGRYWEFERKATLTLKHENIIKGVRLPKGIRIHNPNPSLAPICLEYCEMGALRSYLRTKWHSWQPLSESHLKSFIRDVCSGLSHLHSNNIIHRDLKPENILLTKRDGRIVHKIADLGCTKLLKPTDFTRTHLGTKLYFPPEIQERRPYNYLADYWSLGFTVCEVTLGSCPFSNIQDISKKKNAIYIDSLGFHDELPIRLQLNSKLRTILNEWLGIMLQLKPQSRNPYTNTTTLEVMIKYLDGADEKKFTLDAITGKTPFTIFQPEEQEIGPSEWLQQLPSNNKSNLFFSSFLN